MLSKLKFVNFILFFFKFPNYTSNWTIIILYVYKVKHIFGPHLNVSSYSELFSPCQQDRGYTPTTVFCPRTKIKRGVLI